VRYSAYGHTLESAAPLPELPLSTRAAVDFCIRTTAVPEKTAGPSRAEPGLARQETWLRLVKRPDSFALAFDGGAFFTLSTDGRTIMVHHGEPLPDTVRHLLIDQVVPLAIGHSGRLVLHACGLVLDGHPIALFGPGGSGKSTLAACFGRAGSIVLADDALVVEPLADSVAAHPAYPGIRVWPDVLATVGCRDTVPRVAEYTEKRRLGARQGLTFAAEMQRLRRMYLVESDEVSEPRIVPMSKRDAAVAIVSHTYVLDASDAARLAAQLEVACRLLENVEVRALSYPRDLARLGEVQRAIRRDLVL
jgi:hypothetical protein